MKKYILSTVVALALASSTAIALVYATTPETRTTPPSRRCVAGRVLWDGVELLGVVDPVTGDVKAPDSWTQWPTPTPETLSTPAFIVCR